MLDPDDLTAFLVSAAGQREGFPPLVSGDILLRTGVRALAGMQKEAIVEVGPTGPCWRLICDEGPWLNGTDLAPFPLAFFTAGLAASCLAEFVAEARNRDVGIESLGVSQDNFYTMEGSALRGTMTAGVKPVQMSFSATGSATSAEFADIARVAVIDRSPAVRCLTGALPSEFCVQLNGQPVLPSTAHTPATVRLVDPAPVFSSVTRSSADASSEALIRKLAAGATQSDESGRAVGLQSEQKRVVHVRTCGHIRSDGMKVLSVRCIQPAGSEFEFLSDDSAAAGGQERAPSGLALLSAGVAFCYMTQIGRYAQITKQHIKNYRISQASRFCLPGDIGPAAEPLRTLVCLEADESEEKIRELARMGEQTCYLHAAYRESTHPDVRSGPVA